MSSASPPLSDTALHGLNAPDSTRVRWKIGRVELDETRLELTLDAVLVEVEPKPLELLMFMLRRFGEVVTREEILEALWPNRIVSDGVITNCVAKLRTAMGDVDQTIIRTVPRYGYRLTATVERLRSGEPAAPSNDLHLKAGDALPLRPKWFLTRQLSSGAHGEVWLATREKSSEARVIKFARDAQSLSALKREITLCRLLSQTLGECGHFVKLLDWNVEQAPFFIETEYSDLGNLGDWCHAQGGITALPLPLRIELTAQAAAAAAAHSAGVLHKDLKPSNLIVVADAQGSIRLRLCDFAGGHVLDTEQLHNMGITRLGFTRTAPDAEAGTPLYLAPEILAGNPPTVLSDVYSLGVLLFQMVVGDFKRAPTPGWEADVSDPLLREDIQLAAFGNPQQRLSDAGQLALRLRSLATRRGEWQAQRDQGAQAELMRQALERTRARRGLLFALIGTLVLGITLAGWLYMDARQARDEARLQAQTTGAVMNFVTEDLLASANPLTANGNNLRVRDLLDASVLTLDQRFPSEILVKAKLQKVIGSAYGSLGNPAQAERLLLQAEKTMTRLLGDGHADTQAVRLSLRETYRINALLQKMGPVSERIVQAEIASGRPQSATWFEGEWGARNGRCIEQAGAIWLADCSAGIRELIPQAEKILGPNHLVTGRLYWGAGFTSVMADKAAEAEPLIAKAHQILSGIYPSGNARLAEIKLIWAQVLHEKNQMDAGDRLIESAFEELEATVGHDQAFYVTARMVRARGLLRKGKLAEAAPEFEAVYRWRVAAYGSHNYSALIPLQFTVLTLLQMGRADQALALAQDNAESIAKMGLPEDANTLRSRVIWIETLRAAGRHTQAAPIIEANLVTARRLFTRGQWLLGSVVGQSGQWLVDQGRVAEGLPLLQEAVTVLQTSRGAADPRTLRAKAALQKAAGMSEAAPDV